MRVAIEGCCHAELDAIYGTLEEADRVAGQKTDLLLICGDFQAIRNEADLACLAVPQKYRQLGEFHKYYEGTKTAPVLTIIIGGNHEASNYMWELYHGGWVAPQIYYLGIAGSILVNGLRISGASGIFNPRDYQMGHFERMPYTDSTMRSIYHIREYDVFRLAQLRLSPPHIFLSHDWPLSIERHGDLPGLLRAKPFFTDEIRDNRLGSPPLLHLLQTLQPPFWFAAHLHVRFPALFKHDEGAKTLVRGEDVATRMAARARGSTNGGVGGGTNNVPLGKRKPVAVVEPDPAEIEIDVDIAEQPDAAVDESVDVKAGEAIIETANGDGEIQIDMDDDEPVATSLPPPATADNPDEIDITLSDDDAVVAPTPATAASSASAPLAQPTPRATRFLALSKCLPGKDFLQILDFPTPSSSTSEVEATLDPLWLAITRAFHPHLPLDRRPAKLLPQNANVVHAMIEKELSWIRANVRDRGEVALAEAQQFVKTAPGPSDPGGQQRGMPPWYTNPQTVQFCQLLDMELKINPAPADFVPPEPLKSPVLTAKADGETMMHQ